MDFKDKAITCSACGTTFTYSAEKQEFHHSWGLMAQPRYCPLCTESRKSDLNISSILNSSPRRQLFRARCASCGKNTELPFQPRAGRRVYCSDCYRKVRL